jgi:hypothetical protein
LQGETVDRTRGHIRVCCTNRGCCRDCANHKGGSGGNTCKPHVCYILL